MLSDEKMIRIDMHAVAGQEDTIAGSGVDQLPRSFGNAERSPRWDLLRLTRPTTTVPPDDPAVDALRESNEAADIGGLMSRNSS
jgi:hypothetical protein